MVEPTDPKYHYWPFKVGARLTREQINRAVGANPQQGITPSASTHQIVVYTDPSKSARFGYQADGFSPDGSYFNYVGEGPRGDQRMEGRNRAILESASNGRIIRLMRAAGTVAGSQVKLHDYVGAFVVDPDEPYELQRARDEAGDDRSVIVFRLLPVPSADSPQDVPERHAPARHYWPFAVGEEIDARRLKALLAAGIDRPIINSKATKQLVLLGHGSTQMHPGAIESAESDGLVHFVGEGMFGHQEMSRKNLSLYNTLQYPRPIRLLRARSGSRAEDATYDYVGNARLDAEFPYYVQQAADPGGTSRKVIVFRLRLEIGGEGADRDEPVTVTSAGEGAGGEDPHARDQDRDQAGTSSDEPLRAVTLTSVEQAIRTLSATMGIETREVMLMLRERLAIQRLDDVDQVKRSDDDLMMALRTAANYAFPLTSSDYAALVQAGEVDGPSPAVFTHRFGSWVGALEAAGVPLAEWQVPSTPKFSRDDMVASVRQFLADPRAVGSTERDYREWRSMYKPGAPSAATIVGRMSGWRNAKEEAKRG